MAKTKPVHPAADEEMRLTERVRGLLRMEGDKEMGHNFLIRLMAFATAMAVMVLGAGVALADDLENDVRSNHADREVTRGGQLVAKYWIDAKNQSGSVDVDGQCNVSADYPQSIVITTPSGITASPASLSFTACGSETRNTQTVTFTATSEAVLGNNLVTHNDPAGFNTTPADFALRVVPRDPSSATASATTATSVAVSWARSVDHDDLTSYLLERSSNNGQTWGAAVSVTPASGEGNTDSYTDSTVAASSTYCYRVRAHRRSSDPHDQTPHFNSNYATTSTCVTTPAAGGNGDGDSAPVVSAGNDVSGAEGSLISLDGTVTDDSASNLSTVWTYSAGTGVHTGARCLFGNAASIDTTIRCTDNGTFTATLTATDGTGSVADSAIVTVSNARPSVGSVTVTATGACTVGVSASFSDAGSNDSHTTSISWGDGSNDYADPAGVSPVASTHSYETAGTHTITVTAVDDDNDSNNGGTHSNTGSFATMNTPSAILQPINANGTSNFKIGSTLPVKITVTDCGSNKVATLSPEVSLKKIGDALGDVNEVISSSASDSGRTMRWDDGGLQYIYNLSTKRSQFCGITVTCTSGSTGDLTQGRYRLSITDSSFYGGPVVAEFDLRK